MDKGRKVCRVSFSDTYSSNSQIDHGPRYIRILVVNKHPLARQGLAVLLNQQGDFQVVGEAATFQECCDSVAELEPEVVVFEFQVGDSSIAETVRNLSDVHPELPVVVLAEQEHSSDIVDAIRFGVQVAC